MESLKFQGRGQNLTLSWYGSGQREPPAEFFRRFTVDKWGYSGENRIFHEKGATTPWLYFPLILLSYKSVIYV
ncbi:MAG: hypothetical protein ACREOH_14190, partial [Candidatus Entotheonellia bacterium]